MPEAYITATRQLVAQSNQWSLEELQLTVEVPSDQEISAAGGLDGLVSGLDKFSFLISGLRLQGTHYLRVQYEYSATATHILTLIILWFITPKSSSLLAISDQIGVHLYI